MKDRVNERIEMLGQDDKAERALLDLSVTGAAFIHPAELQKDAKLAVKIKEFILSAGVVYCQRRPEGGFRVGVHFNSMPANVQKSLKIMVDEFSCGVPLTCAIVEKSD